MTKKNIVKLAVNGFLIVVMLIAVIIGNVVAYKNESAISSQLSPPIVDEEVHEQASAAGQEMSRRIIEEGTVMLKNDGTLPLDYNKVKKVNVFGWRSIDWIYGSEGQNASGGVAPEDGDFGKNVDIYKALNNYGIQYNKRLFDMYYNFVEPDHQSATNLRGTHIRNLIPLREPKIDDKAYYTDDLLNYSKDYSDTAIVVISRMAGEGMNADTEKQVKRGPGATDDNTRHYLEISTEEEALLTYVGANFENVVVLLNMSNPFELGFLETTSGIDACLYLGFTGTRGADAIPKLLYGEVSPSGRTADIFPYDMFTNPGNVFLNKPYTDEESIWYMDIVENIYIGYKWYETADAEGLWDSYSLYEGEAKKTGYDAVVQFPFGYGESYNKYEWTLEGLYLHDDNAVEDAERVPLEPGSNITDKTKIDIVVKVANLGDYPGRDVVEAYITTPYFEGEIEKSAVSLVGFNKTSLLAAGEEESITITVDAYDFASYDCYGLNNKNGDTHTGYELDAGTYTLSLRTDSHSVKTINYNNEKVEAVFDYNVESLINIDDDPVTEKPVDNLFTGDKALDGAPIDAKSKDGSFNPEIPWFSRAKFPAVNEWNNLNVSRNATPGVVKNFIYTKERADAWDNATVDEYGNPVSTEKPTWGAKNGLKLAENGIITELGKKLGADYKAEEWNAVLDQVTTDEFTALMNSYYGSKAVDSVGKPYLTDLDGPAQIRGFSTAPRGTGYPTMITIAQTWNPNLAYEFGKAYGDDMVALGVNGVWGWAIDNHRSAFFGRNHESPSEDAYLAGRIITNAVKGLNTRGRYCFLKHFAMYGYGFVNEGGYPYGENMWITEQGLRENYLKPFRMAFVEGGALGCMTTYQGLGGEHSETSTALLVGVLRNEWDFKGALTTDYTNVGYWADSILRCGGSFAMGTRLSFGGYNENASPRLQWTMREAVKRVLYMWLRADYYETQYLLNPDANDTVTKSVSINTWSWWQPLLKTFTVSVCVGCALWAGLVAISVFVKSPEKKNSEQTDISAEGENSNE